MAMDPLLNHLERTFADAYRKEIDQEENVWRSLPFFAATLALQLTALAPIRDWVGGATGWGFGAAAALLAVAGFATLAALAFLAFSVWPADFRRVAPEPAFRAYAENVRAEAQAAAPEGSSAQDVAETALATVKAALAEQYALAVDHNRLVNEGRAKWRTRAGLATLASVFAVLVLVALVVLINIHAHAKPGADGPGGRAASDDAGPAPAKPGAATADDRAAQGLVGQSHDGAPGRRAGPGRP